MVILSRLILALISVLVLAEILPNYAVQMFPKDYESVSIYYSAPEERILLSRFRSGTWHYTDIQGNELSEDEIRVALPFNNVRTLQELGKLPSMVAGWPFDLKAVARYGTRMRASPFQMDRADFSLYTLMESVPGIDGLETPPDMFRLTNRIEFIVASTNQIDEEKSSRFSQALDAAGFEYPARMVGDNPSTMKNYDNGALLVDADWRVFHLLQVNGEPKVVRTDTVLPSTARSIHILEQSRREYHGLVKLPDQLVLLDWETYAPHALPLQAYDPARDFFSGEGNPLHWEFSHSQDGMGEKHFVLADQALQPLQRFTWQEGEADHRKRAIRTNVMGFLFPFEVDYYIRERSQRGLYFGTFNTAWWVTLAGIATALAAYMVWTRRRYRCLPHWFDLVFVLFTGWLGAIALALLGPLTGLPKNRKNHTGS